MQSPNLVLLSGQMALERALNITANNVANASTNGFKRESIAFDTYLSRPEPGKPPLDFVVDKATYRDTSNGPISSTGNPLDLAIQGKGYFEVQLPNGTTAYTRGGSFQTDSQGQIVDLGGDPVLNNSGSPILVPSTTSQINISPDGFITARVDKGQGLATLGQLGFVSFADEQALQPMGRGLYTTTQASETATKSTVVQGALEDSNVQPIAEINNLIQIMRNYEQVSNMISNENQRHSTAIDRLSQTT